MFMFLSTQFLNCCAPVNCRVARARRKNSVAELVLRALRSRARARTSSRHLATKNKVLPDFVAIYFLKQLQLFTCYTSKGFEIHRVLFEVNFWPQAKQESRTMAKKNSKELKNWLVLKLPRFFPFKVSEKRDIFKTSRFYGCFDFESVWYFLSSKNLSIVEN